MAGIHTLLVAAQQDFANLDALARNVGDFARSDSATPSAATLQSFVAVLARNYSDRVGLFKPNSTAAATAKASNDSATTADVPAFSFPTTSPQSARNLTGLFALTLGASMRPFDQPKLGLVTNSSLHPDPAGCGIHKLTMTPLKSYGTGTFYKQTDTSDVMVSAAHNFVNELNRAPRDVSICTADGKTVRPTRIEINPKFSESSLIYANNYDNAKLYFPRGTASGFTDMDYDRVDWGTNVTLAGGGTGDDTPITQGGNMIMPAIPWVPGMLNMIDINIGKCHLGSSVQGGDSGGPVINKDSGGMIATISGSAPCQTMGTPVKDSQDFLQNEH